MLLPAMLMLTPLLPPIIATRHVELFDVIFFAMLMLPLFSCR